jgi:hypothetical protein
MGANTYCLTPVAGISPATTAPAITPDEGLSTGVAVPLAVLNSKQLPCTSGEFRVDTYSLTTGGPTPSNAVAFTIVVP